MHELSNTSLALLGYIALFMVLLGILGGMRVALSVSGKRAANNFSPSGDDVSPFSGRLCRAHANIYEFFPIAGGLLLYAIATGNTAVTNGLALLFLGARIAQSVSHVLSTSNTAVLIRFVFFIIQVGIAAIWLLKFLGILG